MQKSRSQLLNKSPFCGSQHLAPIFTTWHLLSVKGLASEKIPNVIRSKRTLSLRFYHIVSCNINISLIMTKQMPLLFSQLADIITSSKWWFKCQKRQVKIGRTQQFQAHGRAGVEGTCQLLNKRWMFEAGSAHVCANLFVTCLGTDHVCKVFRVPQETCILLSKSICPDTSTWSTVND